MIILGRGIVVTFSEKYGIINKGGVVLDGEGIMDLGQTADLLRDYPDADFKDVGGSLIMPGMINTHMHLYSTFARGMDLKADTPPQDFVDILEKLWWRLDRRLNREDIYYSALFGLLAGIKQGTTTIFDHHASYGEIDGSLDILAGAVEETGVRANLSFEVSDRQGREAAGAALRENRRFLRNLPDDARVGGMLGLHASFTLGEETLKQVAELRQQLGVPVHIHVAEGEADVLDSQEKGFQGVVDRLDHYHIWQPGSLAIHGVHLQPGELEILRQNGVNLIHNPQSNMGNAVGMAPIHRALEQGLTVGLGTDGFTADLRAGLSLAPLLQSHERTHPSVGTREALALWEGNREIARQFFDDRLGVLTPGAPSDIIVLDYQSPTPITEDNIGAHLLMGLPYSTVETTIVGGQMLMEDREVKVLDEEKVCYQCRQQAGDFWERF